MSALAVRKSEPGQRRVLGLVRVSTKAQDVAMQEAVLSELCEEHNLAIESTLRLEGVSGTATLTNSQMLELIEQLKRPDVEGLAVYALDRILRPGKEFGLWAILDRFVATGKPIYSSVEGIVDLKTDNGKDVATEAAAAAGSEWRRILRRTMRGRMRHLKAGRLDHGTAAFGYAYDKDAKAFVIVEEQAKWVRWMFEQRRAGVLPYRIALELNARGVKSANAGKLDPRTQQINDGLWSCDTVRQALRKTTYKGVHIRFGVTVQVPAIVNAALWDEVQLIGHRERRVGRPGKQHLLSRFIFCGRCGHRLCTWSSCQRYPNYRCANVSNKPPRRRQCHASQVKSALIEQAVWSAIWAILTRPENLLRSARALIATQAKPDQRAAELAGEAKKLAARKARVGDRYESGDIERDEWREKVAEIDARLREIEQALRGMRNVITLPSEQQVAAILAEFMNAPEPTGYERRREVLEHIRDFRVVYDDRTREYEISGAVPVPAAGELTQKSDSRVHGDTTSASAIQFKLKGQLAA